MFNQFTKEMLGDEKKRNFWYPIPKTFSAMKKCLSSNKDRKIMINTEVLFRRLLAPIAQLVSALDFASERLRVQSSLRAKG